MPYEQKAVDLFRSQNRKGETDYAYALYNLGTALMDSGKPADAIPYLQERLQVSNDRRALVQAEARPGPGRGRAEAGKAKKKD